jgi:sulfur-oxidizing protein SoxY
MRNHVTGDRRPACALTTVLRGLFLLVLLLLAIPGFARAAAKPSDSATLTTKDPFDSAPWPDMQREYLGAAAVVRFDARVQVRGPAFAEDAMNVPVSVSAEGLAEVEQIIVMVDRNPIRKVLEYFPLGAVPAVSFRFKLEQASPVRAAVKTRDGIWHVGGAWIESAGGGCTAPAVTRGDGSWSRTLGEVSARSFARSTPAGAVAAGTRLRLRIMHPMDTGLVGGVPAFFVNRLSLLDATGHELMRIKTFEPISENPVFSFDFPTLFAGPLQLVGTDNNGNRISEVIR